MRTPLDLEIILRPHMGVCLGDLIKDDYVPKGEIIDKHPQYMVTELSTGQHVVYEFNNKGGMPLYDLVGQNDGVNDEK